MAFDGTGTYTLPSPEFPAVSGEYILAATYNTILSDIANALSLTLTRDGQVPMAANLNMGSHKITNLLAGTANADAVTVAQVLTTPITALKALTPAANQMIYFSNATTAALLTTTSFGRSLLSLANAAAVRTAIGAEPADATILKDADIGVTVQGYDATTLKAANIGNTVQAHSSVLDLLTAVTPVSGKVPYFTGSPVSATLASLGAFGLTMLGQASASSALDALGVSAFIKTLMDDADAATARATLVANIMRCGAVVSDSVSRTLGASDLGKHHHTLASPTLTLPPFSVCENGSMLLISCYSGVTTISRNGTEQLFTTSSVTSFTLNPGDFAILTTNGTNAWLAMICRAPVAQVSPKILTFTRDMSSASGNVDYTGLGFQPSVAMVIAGESSYGDGESIGFDDGTNRAAIQNSLDTTSFTASSSVYIYIDAGLYTGSQVGTISMLSDGVRIAWTRAGDPRGTLTGRILCWK